jgi:hypothetical protein
VLTLVLEETDMIRFLFIASLFTLAGCADPSKGAALNECRVRYYLESLDAQRQLIADCMRARSFETDATCNPDADVREWDRQVQTYAFDNPRCYRPVGSTAWTATFLSPM